MAYAVVDDVQRLIAQFTLGTSTKPNVEQVNSVITDIDHEVNVHLSAKGIDIPVTTPSTFANWLGMLVSYGSAAAILKSMFPAAVGPGDSPAYAFWESRYNRGLKGIDDGSLVPSDVSQSGRLQASSYFTRNPNEEETLGDIAEPWFKRGRTL